ncbi:bifunctional diaminohydroxyphosphoribosylaminopyrimidine deaminase/5-amino-6-(5-phosphoribosylamino)uracil reductase RibD [Patescibacteria group bacterium]|nr:MAG: bifunctional diaminohydroxyphosphoribosylaminopyrimidine deaminase/5-amino-6-(5-phosphoribosylamino)uracil reductase RibD [Patescibacteria group bacterium]
MTQEDRKHLAEALRLAKPYASRIAHGAPTGAVVVRDGRVVGRGTYTPSSLRHAEVKALVQAGRRARGATLYVTLEPCTWFPGKRTGSCSHALMQAGITRVVFGTRDPHPRVRGRETLAAAGVRVEQGSIAGISPLYARFTRRMAEQFQNRRPQVLMKTAMSADGKIGSPRHTAVQLSNARDAAAVDRLRAGSDAILIGGTTLVHDDPRLTVRSAALQRERQRRGLAAQPAKVAVADIAKISPRSRFLTAGAGEKIIFTTFKTPVADLGKLQRVATVYTTPGPRVDLAEAMRVLGAQHGIRRVLLEGGGTLNAAMLAAGLVDEIRTAISPVIIGGMQSPTLVDGRGFPDERRPKLHVKKREALGDMTILWYDVAR